MTERDLEQRANRRLGCCAMCSGRRDVATLQGALRLTELHRFTDPAEAALLAGATPGRREADSAP
jgi:hypothetical protein